MKPSQYHSNKGLHNWLVYTIGDAFLEKYSSHYRGALYDFGGIKAQLMAPFLDKLDRHWEAEASGYFVLAKKV